MNASKEIQIHKIIHAGDGKDGKVREKNSRVFVPALAASPARKATDGTNYSHSITPGRRKGRKGSGINASKEIQIQENNTRWEDGKGGKVREKIQCIRSRSPRLTGKKSAGSNFEYETLFI